MHIVCPSCSAAYDIPDAMLIGREAVRCARCSREWRPNELALDPQPVPALTAIESMQISAPPRPVAFDRRPRKQPEDTGWGALAIDRLIAAPQAKPRAPLDLRLAWIGSIALVLALLFAACTWRAEIMTAWPPSVRLFAALGLAGEGP